MIVNKQITVKGNVQGVYFRATAKSVAQKMGIVGYVKNLPNRDVFLEIEGLPTMLEQFVAWCRVGPSLADVSELVLNNGPVKGYHSFEIER
ncbi:acylphosphatase [Chitinophaga caeni]|uniref:acylphosphatase n=1 Tax=Chitinophaga caeni TaxID=2029983 RepID=A0A291QZN3_9BACT|nr:acylphosphatase [Chitinophaga caeni]ATL49446.1 acylphosphatase [Chitinophaga caeni]